MKALCLFVLLGIALSTAAPAQESSQPVDPVVANALRQTVSGKAPPRCHSDDPNSVIVCGRSQHRYRIDPNVLAAERAAEAPPAKPPLTADDAHTACIGAQCGTGGVIPLIPMALKAIEAAELAAHGDDWRDAFRTHPDQYREYQQAQQKDSGGGVTFSVSAGNK